ncbi:MAG: hypothetical protein H7177_07230 [Rhizobacter sp.]|nr:hypothetical protein [Bacteriovorax sp.]
MIREILTYFSEKPSIAEAKSFGHLSESISLIAREKRCKKAWLSHRTQCIEFITTHLSEAVNFESVLVLGSGPLHEIPIDVLSRTFKKVVLVDIVHLKSTRESVSHLTNIEFVEHEISEIESSLKKEKALIEKVPVAFQNNDWGLVLSINIMSQLPLHLDSYIKKKLKNKFTEAQVQNFLEQVTANHLLYLYAFHCPVVLITDVETTYTDKIGTILQNDINYTHLAFPEVLSSWTWNVAPIPEFDKNMAMKMKVAAFVLNSKK